MLISPEILREKYEVRPRGVLHVGAHEGQERNVYASLGVKRVVWVEANPDLVAGLKEFIENQPGPMVEQVIQAAVHERAGLQVSLRLANNSQASSLLEFGIHKKEYPDIHTISEIKVTTNRLDLVLAEVGDVAKDLDFANFDIQGVELKAMRGLGEYIGQFKWIYSEINTADTYIGCDRLWTLDRYLIKKGFRRKEIRFASQSWGDAFYIRENNGGLSQAILPTIYSFCEQSRHTAARLIKKLIRFGVWRKPKS